MEQIEKYKKNINRAGKTFIFDIFSHYARGEILSAQDTLKIYNTIGIQKEIIYLMAISNGLEGIAEDEFENLRKDQDKMKKYMKQAALAG